MLFAVRMDVDLPLDTPGREELLAREKAYSQELLPARKVEREVHVHTHGDQHQAGSSTKS